MRPAHAGIRTASTALGIAAAVLLASTGCQGWGRYSHPGPIRRQQYNASVFDLYPDQQMGPEVVGARPSGYQNPKSQADRSRWVQSNLGGPPSPYARP